MISEKELIARIESNALYLLGEVSISEEEYKELIDYSRMFVRNVSPAAGTRVDIRLAITMVQVAIREYKEGRYWSFFCDAIGDSISSSKLNYCGKVFAATVKKYGLIYIDREDGGSQMYVENIKVHAIVTNYYMGGFWEFLSSYYEKNLFRQISDDIDEDLELLSIFMRNTLDDNSDSFVGEETKGRASKSYKLLKATRNLIAYSEISSLKNVLMPLLEVIDIYYYDSEMPTNENRFSEGFKKWCLEKEDNVVKGEEIKKNRLLTSKRPYIHYDFDKMLAYLCIPSQKFRDNECEGEAYAQITINGYDKKIDLEIYKSFGIYISEPVRIPIPSIFDEISVSVESGVVKKFKILSSNYRVLNKNFDVTNKLLIGTNLILVNKNEQLTYEGQTEIIDSSDEYTAFDFYSVSIGEDSIIRIGKRTISLAGEYSEVPYFENEVTDFSVFDEEGNQLIVTRTHPTISFIVDEKKIAGTVLVVNDLKCPIENIKNRVVCSATSKNDKAVTIDLEEFFPELEGTFDICVDIPDEKNRKVPKYVRLSKLEMAFTRSIYTSQDDIHIRVRNGSNIVWPEREDVVLSAIQLNMDEYYVPLLENVDELIFNLELNENLKIKMPLFVFKAGFSADNMVYKQPEYIWYSDLKETLYCSAPEMSEVRVYLNHDKDDYAKGYSMGNGQFRVDISEFKEKILHNTQDGWAYLNVMCIGARKRSFLLYSVLRVMWVEPYFDLKCIDDEICFELQVHGNAKVEVDIEDEYTKEKLVSKRIINSGITKLPELSVEGLYNILPKMVEGDEFGLSTVSVDMRPLFNQSYVGLENITNCRLTIGDLLQYEEKKTLSYDYFIDIREKIDSNIYEGYMHGLKKAQRHKGEYKGKYELGIDGKPIKKKFGKVQIHLLGDDEKCIYIQIYTSTYDESESEWIELYYDNGLKTLLHSNDHVLNQYASYDRFEFLAEDEAKFRVMKKKIRRLRADVI